MISPSPSSDYDDKPSVFYPFVCIAMRGAYGLSGPVQQEAKRKWWPTQSAAIEYGKQLVKDYPHLRRSGVVVTRVACSIVVDEPPIKVTAI